MFAQDNTARGKLTATEGCAGEKVGSIVNYVQAEIIHENFRHFDHALTTCHATSEPNLACVRQLGDFGGFFPPPKSLHKVRHTGDREKKSPPILIDGQAKVTG